MISYICAACRTTCGPTLHRIDVACHQFERPAHARGRVEPRGAAGARPRWGRHPLRGPAGAAARRGGDGLLRKYLVENFGVTAARTVLTQFGFAHGWRMAEAMKTRVRLGQRPGLARTRARGSTPRGVVPRGRRRARVPLSKEGAMILANSYEAEQHLLHFGRADAPVCWTICGLMSGYLSRSEGREIYVLEDRCVAKGDACVPPDRPHARGAGATSGRRSSVLRSQAAQGLPGCVAAAGHRDVEGRREEAPRATAARWSASPATSRRRSGSSRAARRCGRSSTWRGGSPGSTRPC
jgi:hypothetical protein